MENNNVPEIIEGGLSVDDRGELAYINSFSLESLKRFYVVSNHTQGFIRAWHAHKKEDKYVFVVRGTALVGAVQIDNWEKPSSDCKIYKYILSEKKPQILKIPKGYANGFMNLTQNTVVIFFSSSTLEESATDDYRYDARYWNIWSIEER